MAIIGSTGAGKTTLLALLPRLYDADRRARCCSTASPSRELDRAEITERGRPGAAAALPVLRNRSSTTCASASPTATDQELWDALDVAQAADFVRDKKGGLDAADRPGRHQRLRRPAPAAVPSPAPCVTKPEVYLFDDSFSALDVATDARLRAALQGPDPADATVIIVGPARLHHRRRRPDPRAGQRHGSWTAEHMRNCWKARRTYQEIVESQLSVEEVA